MTDLPRFRIDTAAIGQHVVVIEPMGDEIRWRHFARRDWMADEAPFAKNYIPVHSLRAVQGHPGRKPLWDSGDCCITSQMPGTTLVVDGIHVNHDWTDAHTGLMIVNAMGWTGYYANSQLVATTSPYEDKIDLAMLVKIVRALGDVTVGFASAEWHRGSALLPDDLMRLKLTIKEG